MLSIKVKPSYREDFTKVWNKIMWKISKQHIGQWSWSKHAQEKSNDQPSSLKLK